MQIELCPHCSQPMLRWSTPTFNFADGLGWATPWLWICFYDGCEFYKNSWLHMRKSYGQKLGYRCMKHPDSGEVASIPVGNAMALRGDIIDEEREQMKEFFKEEGEALLSEIKEREEELAGLRKQFRNLFS